VQVYKAVKEAGDVVEVFGGAGGGQFLQELRRGSIGTMPFPSSARAFVEVWDSWQAGDETSAQQIFDTQIAPLLSIQIGGLGAAHQVHKEALRRQGVIRTAYVRPPVEPLDAMTRADLEAVCDQMDWSA
jgi:4-hydroxy-tetrahydrodipicolinate synthase